jgi:Fic family protein
VVFQTPPPSLKEEAALEKIEELRRQLRSYVAQPRRWVGQVRRVLGARAIQGSNSIEGFNVSVEDALAAGASEEPMEAAGEDWQAVVGYRRAMTYVLQLARDKHFGYSPQLIRSLHYMMCEHELEASPGLWRPGSIWIRNEAGGDVVYEGPDASDVPALIDELVAELAGDGGTPAMVRAAMAHLNLVMIHPFRDGNGRMSRCLQTLVLAREQIVEPEFCGIEEYLGANTASYYQVLAQVGRGRWSPDGDARPWVRYCLQAHFIQAASVLRRVKESEWMWLQIDELRERHRLPERCMAALYEATLGLTVRNGSYRATLRTSWQEEISNQLATGDLRAMAQAGLLEQHGAKRGAHYRAGNPLEDIHAQARSERKPIDVTSLFYFGEDDRDT